MLLSPAEKLISFYRILLVTMMQSRCLVSILAWMACWPQLCTSTKALILPASVKAGAEFLLDAKLQADQMDSLRKEIGSLVPRLDAGGMRARSNVP